jgi:uncharacterized protein
MIPRNLTPKVLELLDKYPLIALTGPRQSGKTTLAQLLKPTYQYVNLELAENRDFAEKDPHGFLKMYQNGVVLDEIQNVPSLFPYLKHYTDQRNRVGEYILTGSQHFLLLENITQSLAGRVAILNLLPLSLAELQTAVTFTEPEPFILTGGYPRIYDRNIKPTDFYPSYVSTYVERDVRQIIKVADLRQFRQFLTLCAGRVGQLVNFVEIGNVLGVDSKTVKAWIGILEASFIVYLLPPYYRNFDKRIVKSPKLYFYDSGLACSLLGIQTEEQLNTHFAKGALFENMVIIELMKHALNQGQNANFYFWQDSNAREIDLIIEHNNTLNAIEIKSSKTISPSFFKNLYIFKELAVSEKVELHVVYGGDTPQMRSDVSVLTWKDTPSVF